MRDAVSIRVGEMGSMSADGDVVHDSCMLVCSTGEGGGGGMVVEAEARGEIRAVCESIGEVGATVKMAEGTEGCDGGAARGVESGLQTASNIQTAVSHTASNIDTTSKDTVTESHIEKSEGCKVDGSAVKGFETKEVKALTEFRDKICMFLDQAKDRAGEGTRRVRKTDRKSTRLNSSHWE